MKKSDDARKPTIKRIGGYLHRVVPILDKSGKVLHTAVTPFMVEFKPRDVFQIIVGSVILTVPVAFTSEVWELSANLPLRNIYWLAGVSLFFIASFVYFNYYRFALKGHVFEFVKRVIATYLLSALVVAAFLLAIDRFPWSTDHILAIKRVVLVTFPASMAATISDVIK